MKSLAFLVLVLLLNGCSQNRTDFIEISRQYDTRTGINTIKVNRQNISIVVGRIKLREGREGESNFKEYTNSLTTEDIKIMIEQEPSKRVPVQIRGVLNFGLGIGDVVVYETKEYTNPLSEQDKSDIRTGLEFTLRQYEKF